MDIPSIPSWVTVILSVLVTLISGTAWFILALNKIRNENRDEVIKTRHDMRGEIGKIIQQFEQDDLESEKRTNRQIDAANAQIARLQGRLDALTGRGEGRGAD